MRFMSIVVPFMIAILLYGRSENYWLPAFSVVRGIGYSRCAVNRCIARVIKTSHGGSWFDNLLDNLRKKLC